VTGPEPVAASRLIKRSLTLAGHATSLALEEEFWTALRLMADGRSLMTLIAEIDASRDGRPLASACRVAALRYMRRRAEAAGPSSTGAG
jgi:predicted DNA-binding ribbon-helix-helix protein